MTVGLKWNAFYILGTKSDKMKKERPKYKWPQNVGIKSAFTKKKKKKKDWSWASSFINFNIWERRRRKERMVDERK